MNWRRNSIVWATLFVSIHVNAQSVGPPITPPPVAPVVPIFGGSFKQPINISDLPDTDETLSWSRLAKWLIRVDMTSSGSCYAVSYYEDRTFVRISFDAVDEVPNMMIGSNYWRSLVDGQTRQVDVAFGDLEPWMATAGIQTKAGIHWLRFSAPNPDLFKEMIAKPFMTVRSSGIEIGRYRLDAVAEMLSEIRSCQARVNSTLDPFAKVPESKKVD